MADKAKAFLTETASMRTAGFPLPDQADWGFRVGLGLLAVFAAVEILGVGYHYAGRMRATRRAAAPAPIATAPTPAQTAAPIAPSAAPVIATTPAVAAATTPAGATLSPADQLLQEARALRERGDTTNALARLQEATQRDPKNASVLAEMATIYESIQLYDRSNETWRKIEEIGPSAGSLYNLAQTKLKLGAAAPAVAAAAPTAPSTTVPSPAAVDPSAASRASVDGLAEGAVMGVDDIQLTEAPDNEAETNLTVRIPIRARAGTVVDHTKVTIRVYFYDTIGEDPKPVLTDAQTNFEWLTPNHDWAGPNPEVLAVNYYRPKNLTVSSEAALSAAAANVVPGKKPKTSAKPTASGNRHYLGYIVRIYYNDKLQAQRAQPIQLLALFPSPATSQ